MYKIFRTINNCDSYATDSWVIRKYIKNGVWVSVKNVDGSERLFSSEEKAKSALNEIQTIMGDNNVYKI